MATVLIRAAPQEVEPPAEVPLEGVVVRDRADAALPPDDIVDQWGLQSFPASDPPANW
jgi:hypothetical protein